jgi:hypothetical protein
MTAVAEEVVDPTPETGLDNHRVTVAHRRPSRVRDRKIDAVTDLAGQIEAYYGLETASLGSVDEVAVNNLARPSFAFVYETSNSVVQGSSFQTMEVEAMELLGSHRRSYLVVGVVRTLEPPVACSKIPGDTCHDVRAVD